jgi:RNA polymerase sigma factor (TIGR02999 family)
MMMEHFIHGRSLITDPAIKPHEITEMLKAWSGGENEAADKFMPLIYDELRRQARRFLNHERANHTLQTTALVHEAYLRLNEQTGIKWQSRSHFFALAARMMRRILVNYAVSRNREKRGGKNEHVGLDEMTIIGVDKSEVDLLALDDALTRLEKLDARQAQVVELRYFSGLSIDETAEALAVSPATVKREWNMAKAWLRLELDDDTRDGR